MLLMFVDTTNFKKRLTSNHCPIAQRMSILGVSLYNCMIVIQISLILLSMQCKWSEIVTVSWQKLCFRLKDTKADINERLILVVLQTNRTLQFIRTGSCSYFRPSLEFIFELILRGRG